MVGFPILFKLVNAIPAAAVVESRLPPMRRFRRFVLPFTLFSAPAVSAQEMRGLWADAFHNGMKNASQVTQLVDAARAANMNAIFVQVRKRGDAYYNSTLEPKAADVSPQSFDPLADLIQKANTGGPRIEVHAWIVTYNIWNSQSTAPPQPTHPYNLHPDWLSRNHLGATWANGNYQLDQGHPAVQQHTFDVCMDIINRYDVDGIHYDYVRYSDDGSSANYQPWGYNPVAVSRFKNQTGVTTTPTPGDAAWLQWRRDQVTALVRKVYLNAWAAKPNVRVSAALIAYGASAPVNLTLGAWQNTEAYRRTLQDWRAWMEEGILDLGCPMIYRWESQYPGSFDAWADYAKDRQYNRAAAAGMGWYLNSISQTITQLGLARGASPNGNTGAGIVGYSYAVPNRDGVSQSSTWTQLVAGPLSSPATVPPMPWKMDATKGHLMGTVADASGTRFDGVSVTITGPVTRTVKTDATGFFGAVDLPAGTYTVTVVVPGYPPVAHTVTVAGTLVAEADFALRTQPFEITSDSWNHQQRRMTLTWNSIAGKTYRVELSSNLATWSPLASAIPATGASTAWTSASLPAVTRHFFRVIEE